MCKKRKPKFSVGDSVRIYKERGKFHRGYMRDFTIENFTITKVLENLPVPRYKLREYNGDGIVGSFFEEIEENQVFIFNKVWKVNSQAFSNQTFWKFFMKVKRLQVYWLDHEVRWRSLLTAQNVIIFF